MGYKQTLAFSPAGVDACSLWRMWMPHLNIPNSRFQFTEGIPAINEMSECDIVVVQRLMLAGNIRFLEIIRAHGLKIVYDLDDLVWNLPKSNPAYHIFSKPDSQQGLVNCAEWADMITVSTKELQHAARDHWGYLKNIQTKKDIPIVHIDNRTDLNLFKKSLLPKDPDKIVIGWGGSNTHSGDVQVVWELLPELLDRYSNVYLEFVGQAPPEKIKHHPRVAIRPWCHIAQYHNRFSTWDWDIVLAPLEMHKFNKSKSSIKMQEAAAIGKPCLAQDIAPYKYFCSFAPKLNWLLCSDYDWKKKLCSLIESKELREDLGQVMHENLVANFNITKTVEEWDAICQTI